MHIQRIDGWIIPLRSPTNGLRQTLATILKQDPRITNAAAIGVRILEAPSAADRRIVLFGRVATQAEKQLAERLVSDAAAGGSLVVNDLLVD